MSAASRKNDPFNFDDIYRQAGVENLFVKKTLGELKQKQASPGPAPAASPARPTAAAPPPPPAANAATFDLDFLSTITTPGGTPPNLSKHSSAANLTAAAGRQQPQQQQQPPQRPAAPPLDDPFTLFEEVPGAAPAQRHVPPPTSAPQRPPAATGNLLDFDDGNAFAPNRTPAPAPAAPAAAPSSWAAEPAATALPARPSQAPSPPLPQPGLTPAVPAAAPPQPPPDYAFHADHHTAPPGSPSLRPHPSAAPIAGGGGVPPSPSRQPDSRSSSYAAGWRDAGPQTSSDLGSTAGSFVTPDQHHQHHQQRQHQHQHHQHHQHDPHAAEPVSSSSFSWGHAPSGSGISGYLKAFGKKAVRVAKAGLSQLEHALEGLDQQQQQQHQQQHGQAGPSFGSGKSGFGGKSYDEGAPVSNDEALAWAVRLEELSPRAQQQELAQMHPSLRRKVIEVLREQIRLEHEAAAAPPPPPGPAPGSGAGAGHAASGEAAYGHGGPTPPPRAGGHWPGGVAQVGEQQPHPGAPRERERHPGAPRERERHSNTGERAQAAAAAAPPSFGHDLLGLGSGDLASEPSPPAATSGSGAAAHAREAERREVEQLAPKPSPPPPPAPAPSVSHDLLGMGSGDLAPKPSPPAATAAPVSFSAAAGPAHTWEPERREAERPAAAAAQHPASTPLQPRPPAATAPPTAAAASVTAAAAVHVDDMDDFFSGGASSQPATSTGAAAAAARPPPGPVHGSSSATNLSAGRGATAASGSSTAAVANMLHDEEDDGLGGLGDVDVSEYKDLYKGEKGQAGEPELRKQLRAQREAAKHAKMKAALVEKLAMEAEEAARREEQVTLKEQYKANIEVWKNKNKGNIRGLLGSLHTVLWPDSGWVPVSVGDLLEPLQIKKVYMKANLLVHPDKVRQRSGTADQVAIADMVFDVLKDAWNAFR